MLTADHPLRLHIMFVVYIHVPMYCPYMVKGLPHRQIVGFLVFIQVLVCGLWLTLKLVCHVMKGTKPFQSPGTKCACVLHTPVPSLYLMRQTAQKRVYSSFPFLWMLNSIIINNQISIVVQTATELYMYIHGLRSCLFFEGVWCFIRELATISTKKVVVVVLRDLLVVARIK